ncbi:hypothetical protein GCM10011365_13750 [Marinicella pacifica]|uniref:Uncharacterized protein n=1 Tax=Marinicella pacifica TaxID=1171543 RepID=A0A917CQC9_9GAMM|nr:hypothetical protein [Marinicella pacifica]GGF93713.1 hypothetical protein GCM10011365_13750 [Marinicella pacifica]
MQKNTVLTLGILSLVFLGLATAHAGVKLILDSSSPLGMVGSTNYDLNNNTIEVSLDRPILCNQAPGYNTGSLTKLKIFDPNDEMKGFASNEGLYFASDAEYEVNNGQLFLATDNPAKALCVSSVSGDFDLIFKSAFEPATQTTATVNYIGLPSVVSPGQQINYQIEFSNPTAQSVYFDLIEYWDHNSGLHNAYMAAANQRECNDSDSLVVCSVPLYDDSGVIKGIQLFSGGTFTLDVTQTVDPNSATGEELDFMAGVFLTDGHNGDFLPRTLSGPHFTTNPITVSKTVLVENNDPPTVTWEVAPPALTSFYEDEATSQTFEIRYSDLQTPAANLTVTVDEQQGGKVNVVKGPFVADGFDGTMTLEVSPVADAYTDNPEQVTVNVKDAGGLTTPLTFDVEITPVNDAPSFAMNCAELTINEQNNEMTCTSPVGNGGGNQIAGVWDDEFIIDSFNPGPNEAHQAVKKYEVEIVNNSDNLLDTFGSGSAVKIDAVTGEVTVHTNNGAYGTAEVRIRVHDNGGVNGVDGCDSNDPNFNPQHGCDVSDWQPLTIISAPPVFNFSGVINGLQANKYVILDLLDAGNGDAPIENYYNNSQNNNPVTFSFSYDAVSQFNYKIIVTNESSDYNCDISSVKSNQVDPDTITGTISNVHIDDIVVTCSQNPPD